MTTTTLPLRNDYMSCIKLANETDSKKEDAFLRAEAKKALEQLRKECDHTYTVCTCSQYNGSYTNDYSDSYPGARICLCCGVSENAYDNEFKILTTKPFCRLTRNHPDQIKNPLSYLLNECIEIAQKSSI